MRRAAIFDFHSRSGTSASAKKYEQTIVAPALADIGRGVLASDAVAALHAGTDGTVLAEVRSVLLPPHMTHIEDTSVLEDGGQTVELVVFDYETSFEQLVVTVTSANTDLILNENIVVNAGSLTKERYISFAPAPDQSGQTTLTVTVTDEAGFELSQLFDVFIIDVNDGPTFTPGPLEVASRNDQPVDVDWASAISAGTPQEDANGQFQAVHVVTIEDFLDEGQMMLANRGDRKVEAGRGRGPVFGMFSPETVCLVGVLEIVRVVHSHRCPGRDALIATVLDANSVRIDSGLVDPPHNAGPPLQIRLRVIDVPVAVPDLAGVARSLIVRVEQQVCHSGSRVTLDEFTKVVSASDECLQGAKIPFVLTFARFRGDK